MKLYSSNNSYKLYEGDMLDMLEVIEPNSIDSIVTDPPYELNFMNKGWDNTGIAFQPSTWQRCLEVLKPGGYLLAFGGSRTYHRIACAIEDAGFEIRDTIMWLYGQGFPKSLNIGLALDKKNGVESEVVGTNRSGGNSRAYQSEETTTAGEFEVRRANNEWAGWGSALKPAFEPIIIARKPLEGSLTDNVLKYRVGGLNIEECRVGDDVVSVHNAPVGSFAGGDWDRGSDTSSYRDVIGRFPANVVLTYDESDFDEVCGGMPGDAYRYFYCTKASKEDRDEGLELFDEKIDCDRSPDVYSADTAFNRSANAKKNIHPSVKPCDLMRYLIRLVTPNNGIILDPFNGSGSTGKAAMYENRERDKNYTYIGIELTPEYLPISKARIEHACDPNVITVIEPKETTKKKVYREVSLF